MVFFALIFLILGFNFYHYVFDRRKGDKDFDKNEDINAKNHPDRLWYFSKELTELEIKSSDKLSLKGYLLKNDSNKLAIICHRGRYYSSVSQARILYENGFNVLMPNNRAHDTSEGKQFSMGPKEVNDLLLWIDYMITLNPKYQIVLMGISMGAHIVMMSVGKNLPNNVKCFIEDCGYANLYDELKNEMKRSLKLNHVGLFMFINKIYIRLFHHFSINDSTKMSLPNAKTPGLFIHGEKDTFVPYSDLEKNYSLMSDNIYKKKVIFTEAGHNESIKQYEKYSNEVVNFVNKFIK